MADETIGNGEALEFDDQTDTISELTREIEILESEKHKLVHANGEGEERMNKLTVIIEGLKRDGATMKERLGEMEREKEQAEEGKQALESIAARALDLETEVSRLQHDLISTMSESDEAKMELVELKRLVGEKGEKVLGLEREVEELKNAKAESQSRVRELERKIMVLEARESEVEGDTLRVKEEMREKIEEKDGEILGFKKKIKELESVIANIGLNFEKLKNEKTGVEVALRESEEKARNMEVNMVQLQKEVEEAEKVISGLKERTVEAINGTMNGNGNTITSKEKGFVGLNLRRPVVAIGSTGAIVAAAAVIYVCYGRRH